MSTATATPRPTARVRPSTGWPTLNLAEVWQFRDLLYTLGLRDIKLRYKQTALGAIWVILQPMLGAGIFTFVFGVLGDMPSEGVPYFVLSYAGLMGWTAFSQTVSRMSSALVSNAHLVSKVYFPRAVLPISSLGSVLLDFVVALGMMAVLLVVFQVPVGPQILLLPVWLALLLTLATGLGLAAGALMVSYRDIGHILPVAIQLLLYLSPVGYAMAALDDKVGPTLRWLYMLNPLASLMEGFRWSLLSAGQPEWGFVAYSAIASIAAFLIGIVLFKHMERKFADVI